jgi:hypothetical protein
LRWVTLRLCNGLTASVAKGQPFASNYMCSLRMLAS